MSEETSPKSPKTGEDASDKKGGVGKPDASSKTPAVKSTSEKGGSIKVADGAGTLEAGLLVARAIDFLGEDIADAVDRDVIIWTGTAPPSFDNLHQFQSKRNMIGLMFDAAIKALDRADDILKEAPNAPKIPEAVLGAIRGVFAQYTTYGPAVAGAVTTPLGGVGKNILAPSSIAAAVGSVTNPALAVMAGVSGIADAAVKLATFVKTEAEYANVAVSGLDDDLLAASVADKLTSTDKGRGHKVSLPSRRVRREGFDLLGVELKDLIEVRQKAEGGMSRCEAQCASIAAQLQQLSENAQDSRDSAIGALTAAQQAYGEAFAALKLAAATFDEMIVALTSAPEEGKALSTLLAEEFALKKLMDDSPKLPVLYLKLHLMGGGTLTRTGALKPNAKMEAAGGVAVSYFLVDPDGWLLKSGNINRHSGYGPVEDVSRTFYEGRYAMERR